MLNRRILIASLFVVGLSSGLPAPCNAQAQMQVLSSSPPNVEYQYQMYYPRLYGGYGYGGGGYGGGYGYGGYGSGGYGYGYGGGGWPGPGLSLGGSLPSRGREGYSSYYGLPLPPPLGSGVFVNSYAYATQLPGFRAYGLASSASASPSLPTNAASGVTQLAGITPSMGTSATLDNAGARTGLPSQPVTISNAATMQRSREMESFGNENLSHRQWTQAYVNYRNATQIAGDNADAHVRLGFTCLVLNKFSEAAAEFKRALAIDAQMGKSGETWATFFGADNDSIRTITTKNVAQWTKEDLKDQDRLFLLGVVLHYSDDPRSREILQAGLRLPGSGSHLMALLAAPDRHPELASKVLLEPWIGLPPAEEPESRDTTELTSGQSRTQIIDEKHRDLVPPPVPQPPDLPKLPELHQRPVALQLAQ